MKRSIGFGFTRLQMLCRLSAYTLLIEFQISTLGALLPVRLQSERLLNDLGTVLDLSRLPLLALPLLFGGLAGFARPARWEWFMAGLLRKILLPVAVLYLLIVPTTWVLGARIQANAEQALSRQSAALVRQLEDVRRQVSQASDRTDLQRVLVQQPFSQLRSALTSPAATPGSTVLPNERQAIQIAVNGQLEAIQGAVIRRLSENASAVRLQAVRLSAIAIAYALFFLVTWRVWPRHLPDLDRIRALYPR